MLGSIIKELLSERGMSATDLSKATDIPTTTLYSIMKRSSNTIDLEAFLRICTVLEVPPELFFRKMGYAAQAEAPSAEEWELIAGYRRLDEHGRQMTELVLKTELERVELENAEPEPEADTKIIPLFLTPAAAGYASPAFGEDYEEYEVPASSRADFAAKISGDSMEPFIADGSVVLVSRTPDLKDGDVGLFCVDNDMYCKQYCQDILGNIYLFSLNRERRDADIEISSKSGRSVFCYGRVLLEKRPPLPDY